VSKNEPTNKETPLSTESVTPTVKVSEKTQNDFGGGPVLVRVKETGDVAVDRYRLEDIMRLFVEFPGSDSAVLEIEAGKKIVRLDMPFRVQSGTQLTKRLHELLGNGSVHSTIT
jgi:hypothetical protein